MLFYCFHGAPMEHHGAPWGRSWCSMEHNGAPWEQFFMELHGAPWLPREILMVLHGAPWYSMSFFHGAPWTIPWDGQKWCCMVLHGAPRRQNNNVNNFFAPHCTPWCSMVLHGSPWSNMTSAKKNRTHGVRCCSMVLRVPPWCSMVLHGDDKL